MNALALDDACCYGHHLSDQMLSYDAATGQTLYVGPTNEEVSEQTIKQAPHLVSVQRLAHTTVLPITHTQYLLYYTIQSTL